MSWTYRHSVKNLDRLVGIDDAGGTIFPSVVKSRSSQRSGFRCVCLRDFEKIDAEIRLLRRGVFIFRVVQVI